MDALIRILCILVSSAQLSPAYKYQNLKKCGIKSSSEKKLRYLYGDALIDGVDCTGPDGFDYPKEAIEKLLPQLDVRKFHRGSHREGRVFFHASEESSFPNDLQDFQVTQSELLRAYAKANHFGDKLESFDESLARSKREAKEEEEESNSSTEAATTPSMAKVPADDKQTTCTDYRSPPARLCKSSFNTTAPMYGVSLTSGKPVTIVQKFPELLQQVVYETCDSKECDLLHGECVQTYIPYLFLVIPLGPVTLTGQDYVLVESGCSCKPKYSGNSEPDPLSVIPNFG